MLLMVEIVFEVSQIVLRNLKTPAKRELRPLSTAKSRSTEAKPSFDAFAE